MAQKLFVRFSTSSDEEKIFDFYQSNPHQFVFKRDPEIWRERISSGAVTIIEDEQGNIVASSITYPVTDDQGRHMWSELGSTRVALDGLGLVKPLVATQVLRAYLLEPPDDRFVLEIVNGNAHSKHVFEKQGATPFDIPDALRQKVAATVAPENQNTQVEWFQLGVETMPDYARILTEVEKNPVIVHRGTGEVYTLDFSRCALHQHFYQEVVDLSGQDFGDRAMPNLKHGIRAFRDKFHP